MEWLEKIPELLRMGWPDVAKVFLGVAMVGTIALGWVRTSRRHASARVEAATQKARADVATQEAAFQAQLTEAERRHSANVDEQARRHNENLAHLYAKIQTLEKSRHAIKVARDKHRARSTERGAKLDDLRQFDGKPWERPLRAAPPPFVPAADRRTRFVAVANLKGGVGKTTVTANVGMALARRGKSVLLVDLDFQGSLTRLCAPYTTIREMYIKKDTVSTIFNAPADPGAVLDRIIYPVTSSVAGTPAPSGECSFVAAWDDLADVEFRDAVRWLVEPEPDVRFLFRRAFHTARILGRFDYVLFDCPPRLTTACVNALACSDWLLIPVVPDQQSIQAVPRMLKMLKGLAAVSPAKLLGIVMNEAKTHGTGLVSAHQDALNRLPDFVRRSGYEMNGAIRSFVKTDALVANAANHGRIAAADDAGVALFERLSKEIEKAAK
jgi:cellulose biosynthesis protein BcsQ